MSSHPVIGLWWYSYSALAKLRDGGLIRDIIAVITIEIANKEDDKAYLFNFISKHYTILSKEQKLIELYPL